MSGTGKETEHGYGTPLGRVPGDPVWDEGTGCPDDSSGESFPDETKVKR